MSITKVYQIHQMSLFGSYARGEVTDESDVDLHIECGKLSNLLQYFVLLAN